MTTREKQTKKIFQEIIKGTNKNIYFIKKLKKYVKILYRTYKQIKFKKYKKKTLKRKTEITCVE